MPISRVAVIDSGRGGEFLAAQLKISFPEIEVFCETDVAHLPYGEKTPEELQVLGKALLERALQHQPDAIVIACHTLSSWCMTSFRSQTPLPVLSVNDSLLAALLALPQNAMLCLWGTESTIESEWFQQRLAQQRPDLQSTFCACHGLAVAIEENDEARIHQLVQHSLPRDHCDALALACTHYPIIRPFLASQFPGKILDANQRILVQLTELLTPSAKA